MRHGISRFYDRYFSLERLPTSNLNDSIEQLRKREQVGASGNYSPTGRKGAHGRQNREMSTRTALGRLAYVALGFLVLRYIARFTFSPSIFASEPAKLKFETPKSDLKGPNLSIDVQDSRCYWSTIKEIAGVRSSELDYLPLDDNPLVLPKSPRKLYLECFSTEVDVSKIQLRLESSCLISEIRVRAEPRCLADNCEAMKAELEISGDSKGCTGRKASDTRSQGLSLIIARRGEEFEVENEGIEDSTALISTGEWLVI